MPRVALSWRLLGALQGDAQNSRLNHYLMDRTFCVQSCRELQKHHISFGRAAVEQDWFPE